jgi:hypothetical protein
VQKDRVTYSLDPTLRRAARVAAARSGKRESEIVEEALRAYLVVGVLEEIWAQSPSDLGDDEALHLAVAEQHAARRGKRGK